MPKCSLYSQVNTAWDAIQETTSDADEAAPNSNAAEGQNECRSPNVRPEDCGFNARPEDYSGWNTDNNPGYQYAWADSSTYGAQPETFASWNTGSDQAYQYAGATDQNYGAHPGNLPGWDSWKTDSDQAYQYAGATSQNYEAHPWSSFRGYTQDGWTFPSEDIRDGWSVPSGEQEKWS